MGQRSRRRASGAPPEHGRGFVPRGGRLGLSAAELVGCAIAVVALVVFGLVGPDGILPGLGAAISLGILCGVAIGWNRQRHQRR